MTTTFHITLQVKRTTPELNDKLAKLVTKAGKRLCKKARKIAGDKVELW